MASSWKDQTALIGEHYFVLTMTEKDQETFKNSNKLRFLDFSIEIKFPGGKVDEFGAVFWFLADTVGNATEAAKKKRIFREVSEHQQSIEFDWRSLKTRIGWKPPTKDDAEKNWEHSTYEQQYCIMVAVKVVRSSILSDSVVAQMRGIWNFSEEY